MRKCCLMFGLIVIVLIIASKVKEEDESFKQDLAVSLDLQTKQP